MQLQARLASRKLGAISFHSGSRKLELVGQTITRRDYVLRAKQQQGRYWGTKSTAAKPGDFILSMQRMDNVHGAFNAPFHPFVLATTSVGQEARDFHFYCHRLLD